MILIRGLRLEAGEDISALKGRAAKVLGCRSGDIKELKPVKRSLDARRKEDIHYVCSVAVRLERDEARLLQRLKNKNLSIYSPPEYRIPRVNPARRPVVVGFGPAGSIMIVFS